MYGVNKRFFFTRHRNKHFISFSPTADAFSGVDGWSTCRLSFPVTNLSGFSLLASSVSAGPMNSRQAGTTLAEPSICESTRIWDGPLDMKRTSSPKQAYKPPSHTHNVIAPSSLVFIMLIFINMCGKGLQMYILMTSWSVDLLQISPWHNVVSTFVLPLKS